MISAGTETRNLILPLTGKRKKHFQQIYPLLLININPLINLEDTIKHRRAGINLKVREK